MQIHEIILGSLTVGAIAAAGYAIYRDSKRMEKVNESKVAERVEPVVRAQAKPVIDPEWKARQNRPKPVATPARSSSRASQAVERRHDDILNPSNPLSVASPLHPIHHVHHVSEPASCSRDFDDSSRSSSSWSPSSSCSSSSGSSSYDSGSSCSSSSSGCD